MRGRTCSKRPCAYYHQQQNHLIKLFDLWLEGSKLLLTSFLRHPWHLLPFILYYHVSGVLWRIITGSGLDGWIYWTPSVTVTLKYNQLEQLSQWLSKTRSIPYWTMSVSSSTVTDLNLIYRLVTYGSLRANELSFCNFEANWIRSSRTVWLLLRLFVSVGTCLPSRCLAVDYSVSIRCSGNVLTEFCLAMVIFITILIDVYTAALLPNI
jgi:hypothetical protein